MDITKYLITFLYKQRINNN